MHLPGPLPLLMIVIVVLVLFGRGKVSSLMGEFGRGITAFKKGISDGTADIAKADIAKAEQEKADADKEALARAARDITPSETDKV